MGWRSLRVTKLTALCVVLNLFHPILAARAHFTRYAHKNHPSDTAATTVVHTRHLAFVVGAVRLPTSRVIETFSPLPLRLSDPPNISVNPRIVTPVASRLYLPSRAIYHLHISLPSLLLPPMFVLSQNLRNSSCASLACIVSHTPLNITFIFRHAPPPLCESLAARRKTSAAALSTRPPKFFGGVVSCVRRAPTFRGHARTGSISC